MLFGLIQDEPSISDKANALFQSYKTGALEPKEAFIALAKVYQLDDTRRYFGTCQEDYSHNEQVFYKACRKLYTNVYNWQETLATEYVEHPGILSNKNANQNIAPVFEYLYRNLKSY